MTNNPNTTNPSYKEAETEKGQKYKYVEITLLKHITSNLMKA